MPLACSLSSLSLSHLLTSNAPHKLQSACVQAVHMSYMSTAPMKFYCSVLDVATAPRIHSLEWIEPFYLILENYSPLGVIQMEGILNYARRPLLFLTLKFVDDNKCTHLLFIFFFFSFSLILTIIRQPFPVHFATFFHIFPPFISFGCSIRHLLFLCVPFIYFFLNTRFRSFHSNVTMAKKSSSGTLTWSLIRPLDYCFVYIAFRMHYIAPDMCQ